jgi:hypothetical protein
LIFSKKFDIIYIEKKKRKTKLLLLGKRLSYLVRSWEYRCERHLSRNIIYLRVSGVPFP